MTLGKQIIVLQSVKLTSHLEAKNNASSLAWNNTRDLDLWSVFNETYDMIHEEICCGPQTNIGDLNLIPRIILLRHS